METKRQQKFSRMIQRELGEIFQKDIKGFFGQVFITVTQVRMSPDLSMARVYLSLMMSPNKDSYIEDLNNKKGFVRKTLGDRIGKKIRIVPDLHFYLDDSAEYADNIDKILKDLNIPPEEDPQ